MFSSIKKLAFFTFLAACMVFSAPVYAKKDKNAVQTPQKPVYQWRMATSWPGGQLYEHAQAFADEVRDMSGGRIEIRVFAGGSLGNPLKVSETVKNGVADLGHTWSPYDWGKDPTTVLFTSWAGGPDSEGLIHWLYEGGGADLLREYRKEKFGVIAFPASVLPAEVFLHSKKPVHTLEDLQNMKIRTTGAWIEILKELGAAPVTSAGSEVYQMLERGVIDGTEWADPASNLSMGFQDIAKYVIVPGIHQPANMIEVDINPRIWDKLSPQDQKLIEMAAQLTTFKLWTQTGMAGIDAMQAFADNGNEIIALDPAVREEARRLAFAWADKQSQENAWFKKVWDSQKAFMEKWDSAEGYR